MCNVVYVLLKFLLENEKKYKNQKKLRRERIETLIKEL